MTAGIANIDDMNNYKLVERMLKELRGDSYKFNLSHPPHRGAFRDSLLRRSPGLPWDDPGWTALYDVRQLHDPRGSRVGRGHICSRPEILTQLLGATTSSS